MSHPDRRIAGLLLPCRGAALILAPVPTHYSPSELLVPDVAERVPLEEVDIVLKFCPRLGRDCGEVLCDELYQTPIWLIPKPHIVVPEEHLVADLLGNRRVRCRQKLVVRLVDNESAFSQHVERDEGNAASNQDRHRVQRDAFPERFLDLIDVRIHPVPHVFALDPDKSSFRRALDKIKSLVTVQGPGADMLWWLLLAVHRAVVVLVEVFEATIKFGIWELAERAVGGDFKHLADACRDF